MSSPLLSQSDLYTLIQTQIQDNNPEITDFNEGSIADTIAGAVSTAANELSKQIIDAFNKTFISLAQGPAETGGPDDLQTLAVDHYGSAFARPQAVAAVDTYTFTRATNTAGLIDIPSGSIVKTQPDANGNVQRYATQADAQLTADSGPDDLSVSVEIVAVVAGAAGSAAAGTISVIETSLLDSSITGSNAGNATGEDAEDTPTYRETIYNLIQSLAGATIKAIEAKALTVAGVVTATPVEQALTVIQYDIATDSTVGTYFRIAYPTLYIADSAGSASQALIDAVTAAIKPTRAGGVLIPVKSASALTQNWTAHITLNPSGPNFTELNADAQKIIDSMTDYMNGLPVGTSFVVATANAAILAIWGSAGTNDLTAFTTSVPSGDVTATAVQKFVAGTVSLN